MHPTIDGRTAPPTADPSAGGSIDGSDGGVDRASGIDRPPLRQKARAIRGAPAIDETPAADEAPPPEPVRNKPPTHLSEGQILDATATCLRLNGYDKTTVRCITTALDCGLGSIYRYFSGKRVLLAATVERRFGSVVDRAETGDSVEAVAHEYARVAAEELEQYRLMFWLASVGHHEAMPALPKVVRRLIAAWAGPLGGTRRAEDYWAHLHARVILGRSSSGPIQPVEASPAPKGVLRREGASQAAATAHTAEHLTLL